MRLPDFLIIGAQKAGTTWLRTQLGQHPDVYMAPREVHFFDKEYNFARGVEWYASHFAEAGAKTAGEKTPEYLWANGRRIGGHLPDVHRRIHHVLPHAKLIAVLRDPVLRAVSALHHVIRHGGVSPRHSADDLLLGRKQHLLANHAILEKGLYAEQLRAYMDLFPPEQMLVLVFEEDVVAHPREGLARTCRFLGVDSGFEFRGVGSRRNVGRRSWLRLFVDYHVPALRRLTPRLDRHLPHWEPDPSPETLGRLARFYRQPNQELFELLGRQIDEWT